MQVLNLVDNSMIDCRGPGRLGNKFFRNMVGFFLSEKHGIKCCFDHADVFDNLGIYFDGTTFGSPDKASILITDTNLLAFLTGDVLDKTKLYKLFGWCQTIEFSRHLYSYFTDIENKMCKDIMHKNKFKARYNKNNDVVIHLRYGDIGEHGKVVGKKYVPDINYYAYALRRIKYDTGYICSDTLHIKMCRDLMKAFKLKPLVMDPIDTIMFASTCNNIVLSCGTFSYLIGLFGFHSDKIFYCNPSRLDEWHGDIFRGTKWEMV